MAREETQLVLGRGEVYFDRFIPGTRVGEGERYIGNTTTFRIQRTLERRERRTAYRGQTVEIPGAVLSESHVIDFITDNIDIENVAGWYGNEATFSGQTSISVVTESFDVKRGRYYQLGQSTFPGGARNVDYVRVFIDDEHIQLAGNIELDKALGRFQVLKTAADIADGDTIEVSFEWRNTTGAAATSQAAEMLGALRFISYNEHGPRLHYSFPMVRLSPKGQIDLKGDEWQQMNFEATATRLAPGVEQVYIDRVDAVGLTSDEGAILAELEALSDFPPLEDDVDEVVNEQLISLTLTVDMDEFVTFEGNFHSSLNSISIA